jgi:hypothetical protein
MPYDETFVDQLEPYLPSLLEARFLGGEPMLIRLYHLIWERIRAVNPSIVLSITTNGTVIPDRVWAALEPLRSHVCLSIDSLDPDNYARIRKNGSLDTVLANFERWRAYTRERGTAVSLSVCPMTHNWRDLPEFLRFSDRYDTPLCFNTVVRPWASSLASLTHEELDEVITYLSDHQPAGGTINAEGWSSVIEQLRFWRDTRRELDRRFTGLISSVRAAAKRHASLLDRRDGDCCELVADALARLVATSWLDRVRTAAHSQALLVNHGDQHDDLVAAALGRLQSSSWILGDPADVSLAERLRQMTPTAAQEGEQPVDQLLLLRVLLLFRNIGLLVGDGPVVPAPVNPVRLASDVDAVDRLAASPNAPIDWKMMWWMLISALWHRLAEWIEMVPSSLDSSAAAADERMPLA